MKDKQAILQAVTNLRNSQYGEGVTAIKVELEAQFNRGSSNDSCGEDHECPYCEGNWEDYESCEECDGQGYYRHNGNEEWENCSYEEYLEANDMDGWVAEECSGCYGSSTISCQNCEEGYRACEGDCNDESEFGNELTCHNFLMEKLSHLGLAEHREGEFFHLAHGGVSGWHPIGALKYAEFYRDGSVDSEFTFTIMLNKRTNIFFLPKVIEAWNELGEAIGNDVDVNGAGMHMAVLCTKNGSYPTSDWHGEKQTQRYINFKKSMTMLLPALYCLGASSEDSRGLSYRRPVVGMDTHRAAVDWRRGALEFRLFDTCYHKPEHILDNVVVIANCLKYWNSRYIPSGVEKIVPQVGFGQDYGDKLERFYYKVEHIDLLNAGLKKLKPSYYTITEIKEQRNLKVNKRTIGTKLREYRKQAESEYQEYVDRFNWSLLANRYQRMANLIEASNPNASLEVLEKEVDERIKTREAERQSLPTYLERRLNEYQNKEGEYSLCVE